MPTSPQTERVSLTAKEAITRAIDHSYNLQSAKYAQEATEARSRSAVSAFFPTLNLELTSGSVRSYKISEADESAAYEKPFSEINKNQYLGKLVLSQPLFSGFENTYNLGLAKAKAESAEIEYSLTREKTVREALELYFGMQLHSEEIAAEIDVKKQRENYFEDVKRLTAQGRTTRLNALQAEYAVKSQVPIIQGLQADLDKARLRMLRLSGFDLSTKIDLKETLDQGFEAVQKMNQDSPEAIYQEAMVQNFNLLSAKKAWDQIVYETDIAQARHYPKLDLVMSANINASRRSEISETYARSYTVELLMTVPLFSGFDSFSSSSERMAKKAEASARLDGIQADLLADIQNYLARWQLNLSQIEAEKSNLELAEESIKNARSLFDVGRATATEVLDSYARKLAAKRNIARAKFEQILLAVDIQRIRGRTTTIEPQGFPK